MKKLLEMLAAYGDRIGLVASVLFALCAFFFSGVVAPALDAERDDLQAARGRIREALEKAFKHNVSEKPVEPASIDAWSRVRSVEFPDTTTLSTLRSRGFQGGSLNIILKEIGAEASKETDFTEELSGDAIGKVDIASVGGSDRFASVRILSDTKVLFTALELPADRPTHWEGRYVVWRRHGQTEAANGTITVQKVPQQPKLTALPAWAGGCSTDPLDLGKTSLQWSPVSIQPQPKGGIGQVGYLVERCQGDPEKKEDWKLLSPSPVQETRFVDAEQGVEMGRAVHYRVRAVLPPGVGVPGNLLDRESAYARFGAVTLPTEVQSADIPKGVLIRYEYHNSVRNEAKVTFWVFDAKTKRWTEHANVDLKKADPLAVPNGGGGWLRVTDLAIGEIFPELKMPDGTLQPSRIFVRRMAGGNRLTFTIELGKTYQVLREEILRDGDLAEYDGPLPSGSPGARDPGAPGIDLKPYDQRYKDGRQLRMEKEYSKARQALQSLLNEVRKLKDGASEVDASRIDAFAGQISDEIKEVDGAEKRQSEREKKDKGDKGDKSRGVFD